MKTIYLIGLGPGDPQAVTLGSLAVLRRLQHVYVRTGRHPGLKILHAHHIPYKTLDIFYQKFTTFAETYRQLAYFIINAALRFNEVAYVVPGSPLFAEKTVEIILDKAPAAGISCRVLPAVSFVEALSAELQLPREKELVILDAMQPDRLLHYPHKHVLIMQTYNRQIASQVKLQLLALYPAEHPVTVVRGAGLKRGKRIISLPLYKLDRLPWIDHLTTIYLPPVARHETGDLLQVMRRLRGINGCPWDQEQDHRSLKPYLLEEAYEVLAAIDSNDSANLCEELGDLLLQVVFHSEIAAENQQFTFYDVITGIVEKLIRRHPHVFADGKAHDAAAVMQKWEEIKKAEKKDRQTIFTVENYLPALLRAQKLQRKAASVGFDWPDAAGAWDKLQEELAELKDAYLTGDEAKIEEELGDLLFATVNVARFLNLDAEQALAAAVRKFYQRLLFVEAQARAAGKELSAFSLTQLDAWWDEAKKQLNK
ncbi:MAG: nucleoside triphosphate pyrophosphohydrolase [Dethiobacteraceae bacterium]|jgi:tetrapyrrole methylase family protein/MazG family protein|nr:nucleoside triphosphate pyrophosphohydrolase [Bacillota bacterium]